MRCSVRGIAFVTYREREAAKAAVSEMHGRNYHGREITVNIAKPRGPDPKKDGTYFSGASQYSGKYDAGGRMRPEYRGTDFDSRCERLTTRTSSPSVCRNLPWPSLPSPRPDLLPCSR